jgi:hypothetical protein
MDGVKQQDNLSFVIQMLGESGVISTTREIRPVDCLSLLYKYSGVVMIFY